MEITRTTGWGIESKLSETFKMYSNSIINMPIKSENLKKLEGIKFVEFVSARTVDVKSCEFFYYYHSKLSIVLDILGVFTNISFKNTHVTNS